MNHKIIFYLSFAVVSSTIFGMDNQNQEVLKRLQISLKNINNDPIRFNITDKTKEEYGETPFLASLYISYNSRGEYEGVDIVLFKNGMIGSAAASYDKKDERRQGSILLNGEDIEFSKLHLLSALCSNLDKRVKHAVNERDKNDVILVEFSPANIQKVMMAPSRETEKPMSPWAKMGLGIAGCVALAAIYLIWKQVRPA